MRRPCANCGVVFPPSTSAICEDCLTTIYATAEPVSIYRSKNYGPYDIPVTEQFLEDSKYMEEWLDINRRRLLLDMTEKLEKSLLKDLTTDVS